MKQVSGRISLGVLFLMAMAIGLGMQSAEPWQPRQLMEPAALAATLTSPDSAKPLVISIGPAATIKTSVAVGPAQEAENLTKLETMLKHVDRNQPLVIYCGCCPFAHCPNIRPAFTLLNKMNFKNPRLLNLATNLKVDWLDKGYPVNE